MSVFKAIVQLYIFFYCHVFQVADYKKKAEEEADAAALLEEQKKKMTKDIDMLQHKLDELQMIHEKLDKSKRKLQSEVQRL